MGLLEEAIREHLELQRRRGGNLQQIARAEEEALQPLVPGHTPEWAQGPVLFDGQQLYDGAPGTVSEDLSAAADTFPVGAAAGEPSIPAAGADVEQETAEIDMRSVLFAEEPLPLSWDAAAAPQSAPDPSQALSEFEPVRARRIVVEPSPSASAEPDFEWEIPGLTHSPGSGS